MASCYLLRILHERAKECLRQIYTDIFVEYVIKNPLYRLGDDLTKCPVEPRVVFAGSLSAFAAVACRLFIHTFDVIA